MIIIENQAKWISSKCQQCGACRSVCPQLAISYVGCKDGIIDVRIDDFKCIGCKKCNPQIRNYAPNMIQKRK